MTAADTLANLTKWGIRFSLFIDGVPGLFATSDDLVHPKDTINNYSPALTCWDAIIPDSVTIGKSEVIAKARMVKPQPFGLKIRDSSTWRNYLMRRGGKRTFITTRVAPTDTDISVSDDSDAFIDAEVTYVHRECIKIGTVGTNVFNTCTRNYCSLSTGTGAAWHPVGSEVKTWVPNLRGRPCEFRWWIGRQTLKTVFGYIKEVKFNKREGCWDVSFEDVMRLFDRKVAVGFEGGDLAVATADVSMSGSMSLFPDVAHQREFENCTSGNGSVVVWDKDDNWAITKLLAANGSDVTINAQEIAANVDIQNVTRMRRCYVFTGSPMRMLLQILISKSGESSSTYDTLFGHSDLATASGFAVENDESEMRFGAGIPTALIDVTTLESIALENIPGWKYALGAGGQEDLLDIMEMVAYDHGGIFITDDSGRLSFQRSGGVHSSSPAPTYTITDDDHGEDAPLISIDDESTIAPVVTIQCNWDPVNKRFNGEVENVYEQQYLVYRDTNARVKTASRGLYAQLPGQNLSALTHGFITQGVTQDAVRSTLDRTFARTCLGTRRYTLWIPGRFFGIRAGMHVRVTFKHLIDFAGSTVSAMDCEVISAQPKPYENGIEIEVQEMWSAKQIAPTAQIAAAGWNAGTKTATLNIASKFTPAAYLTLPEYFFAAGWKCYILDWSATPHYSVKSEVMTIQSIGANTITFTAAPASLTPAEGDLIKMAGYDDATSTATNQAQVLAQHGYAFMADSGGMLGAALDDADTWG